MSIVVYIPLDHQYLIRRLRRPHMRRMNATEKVIALRPFLLDRGIIAHADRSCRINKGR